jgi:hypothetical protein
VPEDDDALAADRIDHGREVVHPALDGRDRTQRHGVGDPGPALVEADEAPHRRQALEEAHEGGLLPHDLDVVRVIRDEDDVARPLAEDLVGCPSGPLTYSVRGCMGARDLSPAAANGRAGSAIVCTMC